MNLTIRNYNSQILMFNYEVPSILHIITSCPCVYEGEQTFETMSYIFFEQISDIVFSSSENFVCYGNLMDVEVRLRFILTIFTEDDEDRICGLHVERSEPRDR